LPYSRWGECTKESYRDRRGLPMLEAVLQDVRFGLRMLRKNPGFTAVAVLTLALGIGATTAIFTVVDAELLEPLPYKNPARLVHVATAFKQGPQDASASAPDYRDWRGRNHVFSDMAAFTDDDFDLALPGEEPARLYGVMATPSLFAVLGVNPILGRAFLPEEEQWGHDKVVILSYGLWQTRFGGNKNIVGQVVHLHDQEYLIVGVMPRGMMPPANAPVTVDLWTPLAYAPGDTWNVRANHYLEVVARLKPGVSVAQAQADMSSVAKQLEAEYPENKGVDVRTISVRERLVGNVRRSLLVLFGAVSFVLLIACVNVANLMLARANYRSHEFAIRSALGATQGRLLGQSFTENLPISFLGGAVGILFAAGSLRLLGSWIPYDLPRLGPIALNINVLVFTAAISLLTTSSFVLTPALRSSEINMQQNLQEGSRGNVGPARRSLQGFLVISEVGLALLLLTGAALLIETLLKLQSVDMGFSPDHLLTMRMPLSATEFPSGREEEAIQFYQNLISRVSTLPGVKDAAFTTTLPLGVGIDLGKWIDIRGHTPPASLDKVPFVQFQLSSPRYLPAIRARLREGRYFTEQDNQNASAVAINQRDFRTPVFPERESRQPIHPYASSGRLAAA
jgi:putative ABC transport system permease protein